MNKIDEMIRELCPEGVKRVKLGEVAVIGTGSSNRQDASENGRYPFFVRSKDILHIDNYEFDEEAILIPGEGGIGDIFHYYKGKYGLHQRTYRIAVSSVCDCKYVYYYMYSHFKTFILSKAVTGSVSSIRKPMIDGFEIPLPPLAIQQEIVSILDSFSSLQSKLEEELAVRQKQMEFYREKLLTFDKDDNSVKWMKLGDVCEVINGRAYKQAELLNSGRYRVLRVGNFFSNDSWYYSDLELDDKYYCEKGDLLYAWSASFGPHIWEEEKVIYHYHIWKMVCDKQVFNKRYAYYWLNSSSMYGQVGKEKHGATMAHLTKALMESLVVPLPPLSRQQVIVSTLDTMSSLIDKLKEEIELRKKQYEYYRETLLSF